MAATAGTVEGAAFDLEQAAAPRATPDRDGAATLVVHDSPRFLRWFTKRDVVFLEIVGGMPRPCHVS